MTESSPDADPKPTDTHSVFLLVTSAELKESVSAIGESARRRLATRPSLDRVAIVGPARSTRTLGQWMRGSEDPGESVWKALRSSLSDMAAPPGANLLLGAIVIDQYPAATETRVAELRASARLQSLTLQIHGLSLTDQDSATSVDSTEGLAISVDANATAQHETADGQLDGTVLRIVENALSAADSDRRQFITEPQLRHLLDGRAMRRAPVQRIEPVPHSDSTESSGHARLLTGRSPQKSEDPQRRDASQKRDVPKHAVDITVDEDRRLRRLYVVAGAGLESRPRLVRKRLAELVEAIDLSLIPIGENTAGYTWLVAAGNPAFSRPTVRPTGTLKRTDLPRTSATHIDMRDTMCGVEALVRGHEASFRRRGQLLAPAVIVFLLPNGTLAGPTALAAYRSIKDLGTVGWIITDAGSGTPSRDIDRATLVRDRADAANELADAIRSAERARIDVEPVFSHIADENEPW